MTVVWHGAAFEKKIKKAALDGVEEWGRTTWLPQANKDCPVAPKFGGTMRGSLGVERARNHIKIGGGGPAKDYIFIQEMDRSLNHTVGKAGFIRDSAKMHEHKIPTFIKKRVR